MDYTTVAMIKAALKISSANADELLGSLATATSRFVDHYCTGVRDTGAHNYFELESVTDETLYGVVDSDLVVNVWPHKPIVESVSALAYRFKPSEDWYTISTDSVMWMRGKIQGWSAYGRGRPYVNVSYTGGLGSSLDELPGDLVEAATALAARFYREDEAGLSDAIGVTEIGTIIYTKAVPDRIRLMLRPYMRKVPW